MTFCGAPLPGWATRTWTSWPGASPWLAVLDPPGSTAPRLRRAAAASMRWAGIERLASAPSETTNAPPDVLGARPLVRAFLVRCRGTGPEWPVRPRRLVARERHAHEDRGGARRHRDGQARLRGLDLAVHHHPPRHRFLAHRFRRDGEPFGRLLGQDHALEGRPRDLLQLGGLLGQRGAAAHAPRRRDTGDDERRRRNHPPIMTQHIVPPPIGPRVRLVARSARRAREPRTGSRAPR